MREFNLEEAKSGAEVCTSDCRPARIVCYNAVGKYTLVALILCYFCGDEYERPISFTNKGKEYTDSESDFDLMMKD